MPNSDRTDRRIAKNKKRAPTAAENRAAFEEIRRNVAKRKNAPAPQPVPVKVLAAKGAQAARNIGVAQSRARSPAETSRLIREAQQRARDAHRVKRSFLEKLVNPFDQSDYKNTKDGNKALLATATRRANTGSLATGSLPGLALKNTALTLASDPVNQSKRLPGDAAKVIIATPAALYGLARDPKGAGGSIAADYKRRYGPLTQGPAGERAFRARQKKEGTLPEILDASAVVSAGGSITGRVAQAAARSGKLGAKLERVATEPRPGLQIAAGKAKPQELSPNLFGNVARRAKDKRRAAALDKRLARDGGKRKDLVDVEAKKRGNVRPGNVPVVGKARRSQIERKDLAALNSSSRTMMKGELQRSALTLEKDIARKLNKKEQAGLTTAVKFGIRTPEQGRRILAAHIAQVTAERAKAAAKGKPVSLTERIDQLPALQSLLNDADKVFTPKSAEVADRYSKMSRAAGAKDPSLRGVEAMDARAIKPLAELHGVTFRQAEKKREFTQRATVARNAEKKAVERLDRAKQRSVAAVTNYGALPDAARPATRRAALDQVQRAEADVLAAKLQANRATQARKALKRDKGEANASFIARANAAIPGDLAKPAYFKSEARNDSPYGAFTRGSGNNVKAKDKQYKGGLSRTGRESLDPAVLSKSVAKNISRRYNWEFVRDNLRDGSPKWARDKNAMELVNRAERRGIDPDSFMLVQTKLIERDVNKAKQDAAAGVNEGGDAGSQAAIDRALKRHAITAQQGKQLDISQQGGWTLVSKTRYKEMQYAAKPDGALSRSFQVFKGKTSRILLGTPGWLQFQVAANAFLSGLAGTGPIDFVKAQAYFKRLERDHPEQMHELQAMTGIEPWFDEQTRLGATANNRMVNAWRAFKTTGLYNHALNPTTVPRRTLDVLFRADNLQNNAFRKAVLYSQIKRDAYERMGASARNIIRAQDQTAPSIGALLDRAGHIKDLGPKAMEQVLKDQKALEKHAEYVKDFLGDYTTYTTFERRILGRSVMFFGFLRFSLKYTMWTLPTHHPTLVSIMAQLGRLQNDELERIFGTQPPPWELANWFSKDGKERVNIGRLIPFFNATSYFDFDTGAPNVGPAGYSSLPPYMQIAGNALFARDLAKDKPRTTHGNDFNFNGRQLTTGERASVALAEASNVVPLFRLLSKTGIPGIRGKDEGAQSSESSLFTPVPRVYKDPAKIATNQKRIQEDRAKNPIADFLVPILGSSGEGIIRSTRDYAESQGKTPAKKKRKKPSDAGAGGWTIGGGGGSESGGWSIG